MAPLERYVGQTLDEKYHLERLLGQGGMGAVYLATHLGTERYVALKLITPRFMTNPEFVERFKREARAAGRLRHPNVVDVTDFGFAQVGSDRVAYLVMEYLDGCTLSDVLAEENRLPLYWVVDILEQVCAAVHEAHQQGIVHRDLKPDNIWLEPNGLGGYRVKVLDFGIAKLGEVGTGQPEVNIAPHEIEDVEATPTLAFSKPAPAFAMNPILAEAEETRVLPAQPSNLEAETIIGAANQQQAAPFFDQDDEAGTRLFDQEVQPTAAAGPDTTDALSTAATAGLTRVGSILGTPLYMSPEQCRGERLDARSDIYSLGIIAYQMLAGAPPFGGETAQVIRAHTESQPTPVRQINAKLPKRVARVLMSALEKDPAARPQTAMAFANSMRANADGLGALYRRAFALYSEYFPEFLKLSIIAHIPMIIATLMMLGLSLADSRLTKIQTIALGAPIVLLTIGAQFLTSSTISGMTAIIVTQLIVAPMKPVKLRAAFDIFRRRWRPFLNTGFRIMIRILLGWLLVIPGIVMTIRYLLWAPVVLMEGLEKKAARKRARELASRSWRTIILALLMQVLVPTIIQGIISSFTGTHTPGKAKVSVKISSQLSGLINIFVLPLLAIVPALLYLKMRQLGGETINDVMSQIEEEAPSHTKWRQRMRSRLTVTPQTRTPV